MQSVAEYLSEQAGVPQYPCSTADTVFYAVRISKDGRSILALTGAGSLVIWDMDTYKVRSLVRLNSEYTSMDLDESSGQFVLLFGSNVGLARYDLMTGKLSPAAAVQLGRGVIHRIPERPDLLIHSEIGPARTLTAFDAVKGTIMRSLPDIGAFAVSTDGRMLIVVRNESARSRRYLVSVLSIPGFDVLWQRERDGWVVGYDPVMNWGAVQPAPVHASDTRVFVGAFTGQSYSCSSRVDTFDIHSGADLGSRIDVSKFLDEEFDVWLAPRNRSCGLFTFDFLGGDTLETNYWFLDGPSLSPSAVRKRWDISKGFLK